HHLASLGALLRDDVPRALRYGYRAGSRAIFFDHRNGPDRQPFASTRSQSLFGILSACRSRGLSALRVCNDERRRIRSNDPARMTRLHLLHVQPAATRASPPMSDMLSRWAITWRSSRARGAPSTGMTKASNLAARRSPWAAILAAGMPASWRAETQRPS